MGAHHAGWETIAWCEWNAFGQQILTHHFPNAKEHGDITKSDFTIYRGHVDVLTAGFPCQPFSVAGSRKGVEDERHLWPHVRRVIAECRPPWVVLENVPGILSILQPDTVAEVGLRHARSPRIGDTYDHMENARRAVHRKVLADIIAELRQEGYSLPSGAMGEPMVFCVPAASVGAPHQRDRIWIVAHRDANA